MKFFAKTLLEQIEVSRVRQLSGLQESFKTKHADTARAISLFQKYTGLDQTGLPDPKTVHYIKMVAEDNPNMGPYGDLATPAEKAKAAAAVKPKPVFNKSVQDLQKQLIARGAKITPDGFMGPATQTAMKQFGAKGPASGANPAAPAANPNANEYEIAQGQAGAAAAPTIVPRIPPPYKPPAAPANGGLGNTELDMDQQAANRQAATTAATPPPTIRLNRDGTDAGAPATPAAVDQAAVPASANASSSYTGAPKPAAPAAVDQAAVPTSANASSSYTGAPKPAAPAAPAAAPAKGPAPGTVGTGSGGQLVDGSGKPVRQGAGDPTNGLGYGATMEGRLREDPELTAMLRIAGLR